MDDKEQQKLAMTNMIRKQAANGDSVCADALSLVALNFKQGVGYSRIESQLDMEDEDDGFRPYLTHEKGERSITRGFHHRQPFCVTPRHNLTKRNAWWQVGRGNNPKQPAKQED